LDAFNEKGLKKWLKWISRSRIHPESDRLHIRGGQGGRTQWVCVRQNAFEVLSVAFMRV